MIIYRVFDSSVNETVVYVKSDVELPIEYVWNFFYCLIMDDVVSCYCFEEDLVIKIVDHIDKSEKVKQIWYDDTVYD